VNANCFVELFAHKESSTREYCVLILELGYANPSLSSPSENKVTTQRKAQLQNCNNAIQLPMFLSRGF
jgi:hypothetical protein